MSLGKDADIILNMVLAEREIVFRPRDVYIVEKRMRRLVLRVIQFAMQNSKKPSLNILSNNFLRSIVQLSCPLNFENMTNWLFVLYTLNFSLWYPKSTKQWQVRGFTGFYGLGVALKRAVLEGIKIWDPVYYTRITEDEMKYIFRSDNGIEIPFLNKRRNILHQVGSVLLQKYEGTFANCIDLCEGNSTDLIKLLAKEFETYRDVGEYKYMEVPLNSGSPEDLEIRGSLLWIIKRVYQETELMIKKHLHLKPSLSEILQYVPFLVNNFVFAYRRTFERELMENTPFHNIITEQY
ncbi:queuosine salvage protein-like isoform X4 [Pogonomyrmex barbatus]|uniref:Queuosine 5'-phosphate N-glycosylase/hydrolase n=1 Tax=Pogonomyrmex barbatus TaxID=144034 RepID=A0A6I9W1Y5_9HYME|nr:queuosine salvage protein-like isoform X4 [Pogonomyrmex barbatus]